MQSLTPNSVPITNSRVMCDVNYHHFGALGVHVTLDPSYSNDILPAVLEFLKHAFGNIIESNFACRYITKVHIIYSEHTSRIEVNPSMD